MELRVHGAHLLGCRLWRSPYWARLGPSLLWSAPAASSGLVSCSSLGPVLAASRRLGGCSSLLISLPGLPLGRHNFAAPCWVFLGRLCPSCIQMSSRSLIVYQDAVQLRYRQVNSELLSRLSRSSCNGCHALQRRV